ncbi:hypothetical protein [Mesorhizobium sp. M1403]|uniref:hypothetical protein n=1 Tax=Mesorhizobium sp. M1403 TaxID=2957097 RepID=UPI00333B2AE2
MKNWRNGAQDVAPPLAHRDLRPCYTVLRFGRQATIIGPDTLVHVTQAMEEGRGK